MKLEAGMYYTTKDSAKAKVVFVGERATSYSPILALGWYLSNDRSKISAVWTLNGEFFNRSKSENDIIQPYQSPIAKGHNPNNLTEDQVGDGWRLLKIGERVPCDAQFSRGGYMWDGSSSHNGTCCLGNTSVACRAKTKKKVKRVIDFSKLPPFMQTRNKFKPVWYNTYAATEKSLMFGSSSVLSQEDFAEKLQQFEYRGIDGIVKQFVEEVEE